MADRASNSSELRDAIIASANRLGISPSDLATSISYETSGSFDPWKKGPTTQWGEHRGLIQWGEPQRKKYGVTQDMSVADQMKAAERYLADAGVKPGHGLLDVYSAINSGRVGQYNRTDAHNGGAPGTVADKVASMAGHRMRANALLGVEGGGGPSAPAQAAAGAPAALAPLSLAPGGAAAAEPAGDDGLAAAVAALTAIASQQKEEPPIQPPPPIRLPQLSPMRVAPLPDLDRVNLLAQAMSRVA